MRKILSLLVKTAVSGLLLYYSLRLVNIGGVKNRLSQVSPLWLAVELLAVFLPAALATMRWNLILRQCGARLPFGLLLRFTVIGMFFNQTLPSSIGGDGMRIWLVARRANWRAAVYSVFIDRAVGLVALAGLVVICLPWTLKLVTDPIGRVGLVSIGLGCLLAGAILVALGSEHFNVLLKWAVTRHLAEIAKIALSIARMPSALTRMLAISVLIQLVAAFAVWCGARAIGSDLPLLYAIFLVPPVLLVTVVPISIAGWGVREGAMMAAFAYAGLPPSDGLVISLLFGAVLLVAGALGGPVWIATPDRAARGTEVLPESQSA